MVDIATSAEVAVEVSGVPLLKGRSLLKKYGSTTVLKEVDVTVRRGEVLAVLGENGAGKSTLMKILAGVIPHGEFNGTFELDGDPCEFTSLRAGEDAGVILVPQELHVVPHLSIAENMFSANLPGRFGLYNAGEAIAQARAALSIFGMEIDPARPAAVLTPSERRLIVLAAALHRSAKLLILDEPTAALTTAETDILLDRLRKCREGGPGIIYITHRLDELDRIADRAIVLRNGALVDSFDEIPSRSELVSSMLGEALKPLQALANLPVGDRGDDPSLRVRGLSVHTADSQKRARVSDVDLDVYPGEIVGLYGLVGAGRTELARALYGVWPGSVSGECTIDGKAGIPANSRDAVQRGMSLLAEDRKSQGILPGQSVSNNMTASMLNDIGRWRFFLDKRKERERVNELIEKLGVRPARADLPIEALSGGNQQKVLLGRCLVDDLKVLILDEPTLGVDIGARRDIYELIRTIAQQLRVGILLISSDVDEIMSESDRTLVMYKGRLRGEFPRGASAHELLSAATGASER